MPTLWPPTAPTPTAKPRGKTRANKAAFRRFSREWIATERGDSLDIAWLKDDNAEDAAVCLNLPCWRGEAVEELNAAVAELEAILVELGEVQ